MVAILSTTLFKGHDKLDERVDERVDEREEMFSRKDFHMCFSWHEGREDIASGWMFWNEVSPLCFVQGQFMYK